jgi:CheY-like chemotaxis protein
MSESIPDLIITDNYSPDMAGYEFIQRVKSDGRYRHIPIIVYSGSGDYHRKKFLRLGAFASIQKPGDLSEVLTVVEEALRIR